jgi:hypothetical protein
MGTAIATPVLPSRICPQLKRLALVALTVRVLACTTSTHPPEAAPPTPAGCQEVNPYRDTARHVLEVHCGLCHRQDSPRVQARALVIFNLNEIEWARSLDTRQLGELVTRLQENAASRGTEDVETLQRFMEAELALRACR